jgi:hypothetical protein
MAKTSKKKLTPSQKRYVKEISNLAKRVKRAEKAGFDFPEDIIPSKISFPKRITKAVLEGIKSLRGNKLYQKAIGFFTEEKPLPVSEAIEYVKQKRRETSIANLPKRGKAISAKQYEEEQLANGIQLLAEYNSLSEDQKIDFIRSLSNEDYDAFTLAKSKYGEVQNGRREADSGRETGKNLLPDEGLESAEIPEAKEYYGEDIEPEGTETTETEDTERKAFDEEITDEEVKKWRESYEKQKRLPKKEREYIYDGDAIYAGIVNRLKQFEDDYTKDKGRYAGAYSIYKKFVTMLENEIKISGFNTVMKRLDGKGIEIDTALEAMLYQDSEQARAGYPAFQQLAEIIMGRAMTQQESADLAAVSETWNFDTEDNPAYQIDR